MYPASICPLAELGGGYRALECGKTILGCSHKNKKVRRFSLSATKNAANKKACKNTIGSNPYYDSPRRHFFVLQLL